MNARSAAWSWTKRSLAWLAIAIVAAAFVLWITTFFTEIVSVERRGNYVLAIIARSGSVRVSLYTEGAEDDFLKQISLDRWLLATLFTMIGAGISLWKWTRARRSAARGFEIESPRPSSQ